MRNFERNIFLYYDFFTLEYSIVVQNGVHKDNKEMLLRIGPWEIIVITWPHRPVSNMESAQSKKGLWLDNAVAGLVFLYHWPFCLGHFVMRGHKSFICKRFFTN